MDGFGNDSFGAAPVNPYLSGYDSTQNFQGDGSFGFEQQQQQQQQGGNQGNLLGSDDAFNAESLGGQSFENDALSGQDYYGGGAVSNESVGQADQTVFRSRVFDDTPKPGHFALDGTYVPPTNFKSESAPELDENNAPFREWQQKYAGELAERDAEELRSKKELETTARSELEAFYAERQKAIASNTEKNITSEQVFVAYRDGEVNANNLWDRVTKLVDVSKQSSNTSLDLSRFRSLLLQLKHTPV